MITHLFELKISPFILFSSIVMVSIYVLLSFEIFHRTSIAIFGALILVIASLLVGIIPPKETLDFVIGVIDFNTIGLLLGMMIIVAILGETGVFNWVGVKAIRLSRGNLWKLMIILCVFTAITSMFVDNVTIILLMIPVTLSIFRAIKISPIPFILGQTLSCNVGGAATLIGDPPNIIIGSAANIDFNSFFIHMAPPIFVTFLLGIVLLKIIFRKELKTIVILEETGLIALLAKILIGITGGEPWITFHAVIWISAVTSGFIENIPFTTTMVPIIEILNSSISSNSLFGSLNISPLWWALALGAGLGGNGTWIGSSAGVVL